MIDLPQWLNTTLRLRCPACGQGRLFEERKLELREACADCGLNLVGEDGAHYGGAVTLSYGVGGMFALLTIVVWLQFGGFTRATLWVVLLMALVGVVVSFRHSKALWTWLLYQSGELDSDRVDP
jgi:uncharacterized protein (DUF983 family)